MIAVGIKTLKNQLSQYIRLAQAGETVLVTEREQVVAEISAARPGSPATGSDAALMRLLRDGLSTPPLTRTASPPPRQPVASLTAVLAELDDDRSDP